MQVTKDKQDVNNASDNEPLKLKANSKSNDVADEIANADLTNLVNRREIQKRIDNYGKESLELAMQRSKNFSSTINALGNGARRQ